MATYYYPDVRMRIADGRYFIVTRVAGLQYRQHAASRCRKGQRLALSRDPDNPYDKNAIMVLADGSHIGYIPAEINEGFALYLDSGGRLEAEISKIVGELDDKPQGEILIDVYLPADARLDFDNGRITQTPRSDNARQYPSSFKVNFDGAYKVDFATKIAYKDRQSNYAASYGRLKDDGTLIYLAERVAKGWCFGLWNPLHDRTYDRLGACRSDIRRDVAERIAQEGMDRKTATRGLYFANMQWGTNYAYRRELDYRDDMYREYGTEVEVNLLDYAVYFVFSKIHKSSKIVYVVERIGKNWLYAYWEGARNSGGTNLRDCQVAIWKHMDSWSRTSEYADRLSRYSVLNARR